MLYWDNGIFTTPETSPKYSRYLLRCRHCFQRGIPCWWSHKFWVNVVGERGSWQVRSGLRYGQPLTFHLKFGVRKFRWEFLVWMPNRGHLWNEYLPRATNLGIQPKFGVYAWRSSTKLFLDQWGVLSRSFWAQLFVRSHGAIVHDRSRDHLVNEDLFWRGVGGGVLS